MHNKILLLLVIIMFSANFAFGQFSFGGKIGGASTNLTGVGLKEFIPKQKMKFIGGGIINYAIGRRIGIQTELLYSAKGSAYSYYEENSIRRGTVEVEQKLGYFAVPVIIQLKMGDRKSYFHINGGIVYNTLIHENFSGIITIVDDKGNSTEEDFAIEQTPAKEDLSYAFGIGLVANGINFDFRYEAGTKDVFRAADGEPKIYNKSFQVSVGYTFRY